MFGHQDNTPSQRVDTNSHYLAPQQQPTADDAALPGLFDQPLPEVNQESLPSEAPAEQQPAQTFAEPEAQAPASETAPAAGGTVSGDLQDIKKSALQQLTPLVDHLDQTPEERFRTTMMMIQAADDQTLIKAAFEAASNISDEKVKAQALLDVINEINYFTQQTA